LRHASFGLISKPSKEIPMSAEDGLTHLRTELRERVARLKTQRDELRVQIHLANAEVRDEWEKLEVKWEHYQARILAASTAASDAAREVMSALQLIGDELAEAYRRIKNGLSR
jgi:uncharacterized protein with NRDE domain